MYIPKLNKNDNLPSIISFLKNNSFGILATFDGSRPIATHIPLELHLKDNNTFSLIGHLAKANPQCQTLHDKEEVLVIFQGAHTYISSSWYGHENVPTWNYEAVHIYGYPRILNTDELYDSLVSLVAKYEQYEKNPVSVESMTPKMVERQMRGIVGFEIDVRDIQAKRKLSQNRNHTDYEKIITELEQRSDEQSHLVAKEMRKEKKM